MAVSKQQYTWPPINATSSSPSTGPTGSAIPAQATLVGGRNPSGLLQPIQLDAASALIVSPLTSTSTVTVVQPTGTNLHAVIDASALPTGASTASLQTSGNASLTSLDGKTVHVDTGAVVIASSALPSGASTSALQTSGNASLTSIDTKTPALGQALAAASVPVVLTAAQLTTLTPLTSVTVTQTTGSNLHTVIDSGTITSITNSVAVTGTFFQTTQPVSLATLPALVSSAAIIGTVRIDQTTPGTTNAVQLTAGSAQVGTVLSKESTPTALTVTQAAKTIGTTAARLTVSGSAPSSTRVALVVTPDSVSTAKFYIGASSVTNSGATRGIQIVAGQSFIANFDAGDYYIISDTAAQTVYVMEQA